MKNSITIILLLFVYTLDAQTIEREVVSSNGNFYSNSAGQLNTTLGEPVISTISSGTNILTQGFQQTLIIITGIEDHRSEFEMNVYPNPVANFITIKVKELKENVSLSIYAIDGKLILTNVLNKLETLLDITSFAKGNYFLNVTQQNEILKTYKIVKQ